MKNSIFVIIIIFVHGILFFRKMKTIYIILLCYILKDGLGNIINCPQIYAKEGKLQIIPPSFCEIYSGNVRYNGSTGHVPGFWYGLIEYNCNNCTGAIISNFECVDCGIYCIRNDMNVRCRSFWFPTLCGTIFSIILLIILRLLVIRLKKKILPKLINYRNAFLQNRSAVKIAKFKANLDKVTIEEKLNIEDEPENKEFLGNEEYKIKEALITLQTFGGIEEFKNDFEITNKESLKRILLEDEQLLKKLKNVKSQKSTFAPAIVTAITTLLLMAGITEACKNILFLTSNGEVCDVTSCKHISSYSFSMTLHDQICFRLGNGELMKIQFSQALESKEYYPIYETNQFEIKTSHHWRCKNFFSSCWFGEKCTTGYKLEVFKSTELIE